MVLRERSTIIWNMHRLNLVNLPQLRMDQASMVLKPLTALSMSKRERQYLDVDVQSAAHVHDTMVVLKKNIQSVLTGATGLISTTEKPIRIFQLADPVAKREHCYIFVTSLRLDLSSGSVVADAWVLPISSRVTPKITPALQRIFETEDILSIPTPEHAMHAWKQYLPVVTDRCRTWTHKEKCEYRRSKSIPLSMHWDESPLCSCGEGRNNAEFRAVTEWAALAPYVTRAAIGILYAVPWLEKVPLPGSV